MRIRITDMDIRLASPLIRKLRMEAKGVERSFRLLTAESIARRWLLASGVPCWRSPLSPGTDARYSLIFRDGSRAMVDALPELERDFDALAKAKCAWLILVGLSDGRTGKPEGFVHIGDEFFRDGMRSPAELPALLDPPRFLRPSLLLGSIRLLLLGEWRTPDPGRIVLERTCPGASRVE